MKEGDETKDGVEMVCRPLVNPGETVSYRESDDAQTVGQSTEDEEGDLPEEDGEGHEDRGGAGLLPD